MNNREIIDTTTGYVKDALSAAEAGHDWFHIERVWLNACRIAAAEQKGNLLIIELAALLHDIADSKFYDGDETIGPARAAAFLATQPVDESTIKQVVAIIENISFKGGKEPRTFSSIELDIVQDADRLDAIGAIGIARAFHYGGYKNRKLYDPAQVPDTRLSKEAYKKSDAPTINHFYEKLFLLKDRMNTGTGRIMAEVRHEFMKTFVEQFFTETGLQPFGLDSTKTAGGA